MICETFLYEAKTDNWSCGTFPDLDSPDTLVLIFGASRLDGLDETIQTIRQAYPQSHIVGCSSAGEILETSIYDESLSVAVVKFEGTRLKVVSAESQDPDAGQELARQLDGEHLKSVFVLSDGLNVNGTTLSQSFRQALPEGVIVTGGLAGDGSSFERTWVIEGDHAVSNRVVAVGFYGEHVRVNFGCEGGWDTFGPERSVTRSEGNQLFELDGKPALDVYKRYLGDLAEGLPGNALLFPLSIQRTEAEQALVRTILAVNHEDHSMTFAGDIPQGSTARLMRCNLDRVIDGASEASMKIKPRQGNPSLSIAISCVGRRLILKHRAEEEVEGVLNNLPQGTRQIGFYSYGELSPKGLFNCELYNQTMTVTVISEDLVERKKSA